MKETLRRWLPAVGRICAVLAAYAALGWVFDHETRTRGLVSPGGSPNVGVVALGVVYLLARVVVRFGLPGFVAYAAARALAERWLARGDR